MRALLIPLVALLLSAPLSAQETRRASPDRSPPPARISDLAWLAGTWEGEGITGPAREVYSAPMGGQIIGHFIQLRGGSIWFTEIMSIAEVGGSLVYRLKHFNADLTGWEERNEMVRFPLIAVERDSWFFDGLTIRRDGRSAMTVIVRISGGDGTSREVTVRYRRAQ